MLNIDYTTKFKKDLKLLEKRRKDISKLKQIIILLANNEQLPVNLRDHKLVGNYDSYRECHIEPDWL